MSVKWMVYESFVEWDDEWIGQHIGIGDDGRIWQIYCQGNTEDTGFWNMSVSLYVASFSAPTWKLIGEFNSDDWIEEFDSDDEDRAMAICKEVEAAMKADPENFDMVAWQTQAVL